MSSEISKRIWRLCSFQSNDENTMKHFKRIMSQMRQYDEINLVEFLEKIFEKKTLFNLNVIDDIIEKYNSGYDHIPDKHKLLKLLEDEDEEYENPKKILDNHKKLYK
jgi:hypothetical protein